MSKANVFQFLRNWDGYARGVTLLYQRKPRYQTPMGGCCTIISLILLLYFAIQLLLDTFLPPGKFRTSEQVELSPWSSNKQRYHRLSIDSSELLVAFKIENDGDSSSIDMTEIDDYVVGLWFQQEEGEITKVYKAIDCDTERISDSNKSSKQLEGMKCPDQHAEIILETG